MSQTLYIAIDGDTKGFVQALKKAENVSVSSGKRMATGVGQATKAYDALVRAAGAYLGLEVVTNTIKVADTYSLLESRLKLVTSGTEELRSVQSSLLGIANESRNSYEATANLYARLGRSTEQLGTSSNELLQVTEAISKALIVSGATSQEAENALIQLSQGLASGALRGDELRSVLENVPRVAKAIADGMGITVGQLREFGAEGKLTAEAVIPALISQLGKIREEFGQIDITVGQSLQVFKNMIFDMIAETDDAIGATAGISQSILDIAETIQDNREGITNLFESMVGNAGEAGTAVKEISQSIISLTGTVGNFINLSEKFGGPGALEYGLLGAVLVKGGKGKAGLLGAILAINEGLKAYDLNLGSLPRKWNELAEYTKKTFEFLSGQRDMSTGRFFTELEMELNKLIAMRKDVQQSFAFSSEARKAKKDELAAIDARIAKTKERIEQDKIAANLQETIAENYVDGWIKAARAVVDVNEAANKKIMDLNLKFGDHYIDGWQHQIKEREKAADRAEKIAQDQAKEEIKAREEARQKAEDELEKEVRAAVKAGEDMIDSWELMYRDRHEIQSRALDAEIQAEESALDKIDAAHADFFADLDQMARADAENRKQITDDFHDSIKTRVSDFVGDFLTGEFDSIGDAWDSLWKGAVRTMADAIGAMTARWAASKITKLFGWKFHDGLWNLEGDEVPAILQKGEMVIPQFYADQIRKNMMGFEGDYDSLAERTAFSLNSLGAIPSDRLGISLATNISDFATNAIADSLTNAIFGQNANIGMSLAKGVAGMGLGMLGAVTEGFAKSRETANSFMGVENSYSRAGGFLGSAATMVGLAGHPAAGFASGLSHGIASDLGNMLGDLFDDREYEGLLDAMEDGIMSGTEAHRFAKAQLAMGIQPSSIFGGIVGTVDRAIGAVTSFIGDIFGSITSALGLDISMPEVSAIGGGLLNDLDGWSKDAQAKANQMAYDALAAIGLKGFLDYDPQMQGGNDIGPGPGAGISSPGLGFEDEGWGSPGGDHSPGIGFARGGVVDRLYVPRGDDGLGGLKFGERVLTDDQNKELMSVLRGMKQQAQQVIVKVYLDGKEIGGKMRVEADYVAVERNRRGLKPLQRGYV